MESVKYFSQEELHDLRKIIDVAQQAIAPAKQIHEGPNPKDYSLYDLAHHQATVKLIEAKMWVGKMLEGLGSELPAQFRDKAE